jgi:hypothetical protein
MWHLGSAPAFFFPASARLFYYGSEQYVVKVSDARNQAAPPG